VLCHLFHPFPQKMRKKINAGESFGFLLRLFYNFSMKQLKAFVEIRFTHRSKA